MKQLIVILIMLAAAGAGAKWLMDNKPEIKKHSKKTSAPVVKITPLKKQNYSIVIHSSGVVEAQTQTNIVAEVAGKIIKVSNAFQEGNYVDKNDLLLKISETDYRNNINIAKAEIAQQQLGLKEQLVQRKLAQQDWNLFGEKKKKPSELALRTPHIASAKAALEAAKIRMQQAQIQLSRTAIHAPYDGRVLQRSVGLGQYVTPGTVLGKIFSTDAIEVRLPLSLHDYQLLSIPEHYLGEKKPKASQLPNVHFFTQSHNQDKENYQWQGKVVRTSASLNTNTRQISVIARIDKPFSRSENNAPTIKLGQFIQADIMGKTLKEVAIIPTSAIREQKEILLLIAGRVKLQPITILHMDNDKAIISTENIPFSQVNQDIQLILTPPPFAVDGMKVRIFGQPDPQVEELKNKAAEEKEEGDTPDKSLQKGNHQEETANPKTSKKPAEDKSH